MRKSTGMDDLKRLLIKNIYSSLTNAFQQEDFDLALRERSFNSCGHFQVEQGRLLVGRRWRSTEGLRRGHLSNVSSTSKESLQQATRRS